MLTFVTQTDGELEPRVRNALFSRKLLTGNEVTISAAGGTVTLTGCVNSYYARQLLVHCCLHVPGVSRVVDEICVGVEKPSRRNVNG
jgi:osmotically-inducible protein OsmY